MTNEEKAREILKQFNFNGSHPGSKVYGFTLDRMKQIAVWKEQQMIEKAIKWLDDWFTNDSCKCGIPITENAREEFFNDFKQAMKGE